MARDRIARTFAQAIAILFGGAVHASLTPAQVLDYERPFDLHFSADGRKLVYVVQSYPQDCKPRIRVLDIPSAKSEEITPRAKSERSPCWSPDGRLLAFLSNRDGSFQVYLLSIDEGGAIKLTSRKNGVASFRWSPDGKAIAYLAKDDDAPAEHDVPQIADDERELARLWVINVASREDRRIGQAGYRIDELEWESPSSIFLVATDKPRSEKDTAAVYRLALTGGAVELVSRPPQPFSGLVVSPDGKRFAVKSTAARGPIARDLFLSTDKVDLKETLAHDIEQIQWRDPSTIWASVADGFTTQLYAFPPEGEPRRVELPLSVKAFDVSPDGSIAYVGADFRSADEIYLRAPDGKIRQLTHMQSAEAAFEFSPTTIFTARSFDGRKIEAALTKPLRPTAKKMPLVLLVHGGPASRVTSGYYWETAMAQLLASHGYEVLMVNPRGSTGYGETFLEANRRDFGGGDYKDLMAVLDAVIARGETDPNRLGIGGWSYGGEMTILATTRSHRFKAAVVGAGVFNQVAEFETEDKPTEDEWYLGTPWDNLDVFARNSPSTLIKEARTPTLIVHGQDDPANPVGQSRGLYRALKHMGVETELVVYPGEGHSPRKGSYNIDMFQRLLDWYKSHLK